MTTGNPVSPTPSTAAASEIVEAARQLADRRRIIEQIRSHNPSAAHAFLAGFTTRSLSDYLDHLRNIPHKSMRLPGWVQRRCDALSEARRQLAVRRAA